jgi:SAM-dependent methyltransferase
MPDTLSAERISTGEATSDPSAVRAFFDGWSLYRKIVDENYLHHRSVGEALGRWLDTKPEGFSFLDLGCGDGAFSSGLLRDRPVTTYAGIDLSPVALDLARSNLQQLGVPCDLTEGDFLRDLDSVQGRFDVVYIGLSLHHLLRSEKARFLPLIREKVASGGALVIFDPVLNPGETRSVYMGRWVDHAQWSWKALSGEDLGRAVEHVTSSDHPEEISTLNRLALDAGFHAAEVLFIDRTDFYALMVFRSDDFVLGGQGDLPAGHGRL